MTTKKFISLILTLTLLFSLSSTALAVIPGEDSASAAPVLIDELTTDHFSIKSYKHGDTYFNITAQSNGELEFATLTPDGDVYSLWFNLQDVHCNSSSFSPNAFLNDPNNVDLIYSYGTSNLHLANIVDCELISQSSDFATNGYSVGDKNALIARLSSIHGSEYNGSNWAGFASITVSGLKYQFQENLDYGMNYRDGVHFSAGITLSALQLLVQRSIPAAAVTLSALAIVLDVINSVNTILVESGTISNYYGGATYTRYVLINSGGPYYETYKTTLYDGWVEYGVPSSAYVVATSTTYNPNSTIFNSYSYQQQYAYENYN